MRECLRKDGVVLPQRGDSHGFIPGNNVKLPNGMTQAQFLQALKRCGGDRRPSGAGRLYSRNRFHAALASFAECLRRYGVHVPPLNNSGKGPLLNTKDLNANTPKFREASAKCRATLLAGLNGARKGAAGAAGGAAGVGASG